MSALNTPVRGFFTYPWDLLDEPVEQTLLRMRDVSGCNAIALAASYHSGSLLTPRRSGALFTRRERSMVMYHPDLSLYPAEGPWPVEDSATADVDIIGQVSAGCANLSMQLNLWLVLLHNSTLGEAHSDLCARNLTGDTYTFSLCPAQPRVRAYAVGLVRDVCRQYRPHTLLLESASFMPALHGAHHEIALVHLGSTARWLLGLCFCAACVGRAEAARLDVEATIQDARTLLDAVLDVAETGESAYPRFSDLGSALLARPRLRTYAEMRIQTVMSLLQELRDTAHEYGVRIEVIPNSGVRPLAQGWTLGVEVGSLGEVVDGALVLAYYPAAGDVMAELGNLAGLARDLAFSVALNVGAIATPTRNTLIQNALAAARSGARGLFYYNWGLLSQQRLEWVRDANQAVLAG